MRSIKQQKITYRTQSFGIISTKIRTQQGALDELTITYGNQKLNNPYLLSLQIENTGNETIANPPICIRAKNSSVLIPGYFEDVPNGYEDKWTLERETDNSCKVVLEHINPKQIVKAHFFLDRSPEIIFECPMPNVVIQRIGDTGMLEEVTTIGNRKQKLQRATLALITLTLTLYASMPYWLEWLYSFGSLLLAPPWGIAAFVFSALIISILLNIFGVNKLDRWIMQSKSRCRLVKGGLAICSIILLVLILFDILIVREQAQIVTACRCFRAPHDAQLLCHLFYPHEDFVCHCLVIPFLIVLFGVPCAAVSPDAVPAPCISGVFSPGGTLPLSGSWHCCSGRVSHPDGNSIVKLQPKQICFGL